MSVNLQHVTKIYGTQKAVDDVSFTVHTGDILGFLGPNGAGKSTTMKMITGYLKPTAGTVHVENIPVTGGIETKKLIGYLPENNPLYTEMYVREYLRFCASIYKISNIKQRVDEVIDLVGLTSHASKKIGALSKGYKQRTGLAAVLIHNPPVLILDEPTTGLDPNQIIEIRQLIKSLANQKTIMLSTHILQEVEAICNRIIIIDKGHIVADSNLADAATTAPQPVLEVVFKTPPQLALFKNIDQIQKIELVGNKLLVLAADIEQVQQQVLSISLQHQIPIISMQTQLSNLESLFHVKTQTAASE